jgi:hypothetical protein
MMVVEAAVAASAGRPEEEDDRAGRADWAGKRLRPSCGWRWWPKRREKESGRSGWKERRAAAGPEFKRNSFRISIDFRIWQNFRKLHKEI